MPGHYSNTSGIVADTTIDVGDVKTPVDALDDALYAYVTGASAFSALTVNADTGTIAFRLTSGLMTLTGYNALPRLVMRRAQGTVDLPTQTTALAALGGFAGQGWTDSAAFSADVGYILIRAFESFTSSAQGTYIEFQTTPSGTTTPAVALTIGNDKKLTIAGDLLHQGSNLGFYATAAAARQAQAALTGTPQAGTFATGTVTLPQLAGVVMNLITTLRLYGLLS